MESVGTRWNRWSALLVGSCACSVLLSACGSAANVEPKAKAPHEQASVEADPRSGTEESAGEPEESPKAALCDDGTCSPCGAGVCPSGWYCDESASGGPACGWLPRCAQKSSCGCLTGKLGAGCQCSEQSGGLHVTCK